MGSRPLNSRKERDEVNRKQRKARYINAKNMMRRYPDCNYGEFFCNHVYDPKYPWSWVDFRFFHSTLKRYFAVAMTTAEYAAVHTIDAFIDNKLDELMPYPDNDFALGRADKDGNYQIIFSDSFNKINEARSAIAKQMRSELYSKPQMMRPHIDVKDYGPVAVGLWVTVNTQHIDEHVISDFIKFFRSLGEPITPGFKWEGDEIEVIPERLIQRNDTES